MSGEPKTRVMTLEEAVEALYSYGMELRAESLTGEGVSWSVFEFSTELGRPVLVCNGHGTWWEAVSDALGVPVAARDEAAEDCFCDKCGWTGKALYPDYRHEGCGYGALPLWRMELYAAKKEAAELREENKRLRASVDDLLLAPNPLDDENMRLRTEVAELRAAIREWVEATDDAEAFELDQTNAYGTDHADAEDRVEAAVKALRALAATEGSES